VAAKVQVRNQYRANIFSAFSALTRDYPLVPELVYPAAGMISFDLQTILKSNNDYGVLGSVPNFFSQLIFQGARRFPQGRLIETGYRWYPKWQQITADITVNWTGRISPAFIVAQEPRRFNVPIRDHDFELYRIGLVQKKPAPALHTASFGSVKLMLYDVVGNQLMSAPVTDFFLSDIVQDFHSVFPVPPLLYPAGSDILFDVTSLLVAADIPMTLSVTFMGVWRIPC
jgi:hypothetical protein